MLSLRSRGRRAAAVFSAGAVAAGTALAAIVTLTAPDAAAAPAGPGITLTETAFPAQFAVPGEAIHYSYTVTNTGNVTLRGVTVRDSRLGAVACETATLVPGEFTTCEADYVTTSGDVANLFITSSATATSRPPAGPPVTGTDTQVVYAVRQPGIKVRKTAFPARYAVAGERISYTYTVTNTGDAVLDGVTVVDDELGVIACPLIVLDPGVTMTCTATYTTTRADVSAERLISNGVTVSGLPPAGGAVTGHDRAFVKALRRAGIMVRATASTAGFGSPGQAIRYAYTVVNVGNRPLHGIAITGGGIPAAACPATVLASAAVMTCHASHITTQADVRARSVASVVFATSLTANGTQEVDRDMTIAALTVVPVTG